MGLYVSQVLLIVLLLDVGFALDRELQAEIDELRGAVVNLQLDLLKLHSLIPPPETKCPYPFTKVINECFYVSKKRLSWGKARRHCRGMGGDLATPTHLYAVNSFIILSEGPFTNPVFLDTWVGGTWRIDGNWWWLNNITVNEEDWHSRHPDSSPGHCLYITSNAVADEAIVVNYVCHHVLRFVCQIPLQA